jgi:hypothetical protein
VAQARKNRRWPKLDQRCRRMQDENRAAEGKKRLKCEQQKERREEKETIMWMNHAR